MSALTNWAGNIEYSTTRLERPWSVMELQALIVSSTLVHAVGTGHSFNTIADTTGTLVSVADLDVGGVVVDADARTASVPGGMRFGELAEELHAQGWALANLGSLPHISVAGACATGTHGSGDANRCIAATAVAVEFVDGTGTVQALAEDHADFGGAVLALGALGVVTRVTLRIEPTWEARQDVWLDLPWASFEAHLDEIMAAGYSVSVFTDFHDLDVAEKLWIKTRGDVAADATRWGAQAATTPQNPVTGHDPDAATEQLGRPGPWHERIPHFRLAFTPSNGDEQQSEYLIDRQHARAVLAALRGVAPSLLPALEVCEIRTVAADTLWLSPCHDRDTLAVHITWVDDDAQVVPAVAALEAALAPFDPRPHWGKVFAASPEAVRAHYPQLPAFQALVDRYDPQRRFANGFLQRYVY